MQVEIIILAVIVFVIMAYTGQININQLIIDNQMFFMKLKESDWDFYVQAKYGNGINPDILFNKRIKNALIVMVLVFLFMINGFNSVKLLLVFVIGFFVFKILIQHYTVPVAIGKSMADAPEIFREGLREMIDAINSGDDSIEPYMAFARKYPVRDSMRMMRLLYRLSLGRQERKQEQILAFSRTISSLQQKARETRYKNRLEKMENKTMSMLKLMNL